MFQNHSDNWHHIHESERFAQIAIQKKATKVELEEVKEFEDKTIRGEGAFGSTNSCLDLQIVIFQSK